MCTRFQPLSIKPYGVSTFEYEADYTCLFLKKMKRTAKIALAIGGVLTVGALGVYFYTKSKIPTKDQFEEYKRLSLNKGEDTFQNLSFEQNQKAFRAYKKNLTRSEAQEMIDLIPDQTKGGTGRRLSLLQKWLGRID